MGGSTSAGSTSAKQDTATEWVAWRWTTAPLFGRCRYMAMCRKDSLVGGSPETSLPLASSRASRAGSRRSNATLVGVISQPSSNRALMLPELPKVRPRPKMDLP